jgi:uncharacterized protein (TIGR03067 family)
MRHQLLLLLPAALALGFAPAPFSKPDPRKIDLKKLQGTWLVVATETDGKRSRLSGEELTLTYSGNKFVCRVAGVVTQRGKFTITAGPGRDAVVEHMILAGGGTGLHFFCLSRMEGDTLTACGSFGPAAPKALRTRPGDGCFLRVAKRRPAKRGE